jgi:acyl dehydratase
MHTPRSLFTLATLTARIGQEVAVSDWLVIDQTRIDHFAAVCGDDQWIHTDPVRAAASPFGATIAHGFLTLSLLASLMRETVGIDGMATAINYGLNRVRFVTPVPAGARIRARFVPSAVGAAGGGVQVTWNATIELDGSSRPAAVAEWIVRYGDISRPQERT